MLHAPAVNRASLNGGKNEILDKQANENHEEETGKNVGGFELISVFKNVPTQPATSG